MHYVVASLHLKALDYFNFSGFSANVVYTKNWFVCVLLSCCYTCFVYASILCYKTVQVQVLWWRMIKVMLLVQEYTPYSNSWQVKIHDLCKVSCICSSYAFGFIKTKWTSKHVEVMQRRENVSTKSNSWSIIWPTWRWTFWSTPLSGAAGWRKDWGRNCGLLAEISGVYGTLILLLS